MSLHKYNTMQPYNEGIDTDIFCENNRPFGNACRFNRSNVVKYLISKGVDMTSQKYYGFCWSCKNGHKEIVQLLIDNGINVNARKSLGLSLAVENNRLEIVNLLLEQGANPNGHKLFDEYDSYPVIKSSNDGYMDILKSLISYGANIDIEKGLILTNVCKFGDFALAKTIIEKNIDPTSHNSWAITQACLSGNLELVKYLKSCGLDIYNRDGLCIVYACASGNLDLVKYVNEFIPFSDSNEKAIIKVVEKGYYNIFDYIIKKNIDIANIKSRITQNATENNRNDFLELINSK